MTIEDEGLVAFGRLVRQRRQARKLSLRALASLADISPSYIAAIESAHNPTTGRAPQPAFTIVERLKEILGLDGALHDLHGHDCGDEHDHVLLYLLGDSRRHLMTVLARLYPDQVDQWLCISDPRSPIGNDAKTIAWHWNFGTAPYPDDFLVPDRIIESLRLELAGREDSISGERLGLVIADCSAVMRWMVNPESEVEFETEWADRSADALVAELGRRPVVNVCVYNHSDIEALSSRLDVLDAVLRLIRSHRRIILAGPEGLLLTGAAAISAILEECRPAGASSTAWRAMAKAAATAMSQSAVPPGR